MSGSLLTILDCGCEIWEHLDQGGEEYFDLEQCPMHEATPDLLDTLQHLRDEFQALFNVASMTGSIEVKPSAFEKLVAEIDEAISKVKGGEL